ncbi:hypothetical protein N7494_010480 [Penicillium frequentans]|uniref:Uncharacterized protein n=1 Tax=Penicillium frequentans TaxID=3151616 RepID=A0AAD6CJN6_9EURO|nr:hypothetical protein N7494_010480 [Penicillium glabrum]
MQFSQILAVATFAAMASAAALPVPEAAPAAAPNADAEADPGICGSTKHMKQAGSKQQANKSLSIVSSIFHEIAHCSEGEWPCDN